MRTGLSQDCNEWNPHLVYEHDGENCLVDVLSFAAGGERERGSGVRRDIWLNMWPKLGQSVATANWVRVQWSSTYGKPETLFRMILSWALLQARMGTPVVWKKKKRNFSLKVILTYRKKTTLSSITMTELHLEKQFALINKPPQVYRTMNIIKCKRANPCSSIPVAGRGTSRVPLCWG